MSDDVAGALIDELGRLNERLTKAVAGLSVADLDRALGQDLNSIAVIVTHATGSEIGWLHLAAGRPLRRDRDAEFRVHGKTAEELAVTIDRANATAPELVRAGVAAGLGTTRRARDRDVTVAYALHHAVIHLAEHVGHVEMTRQLIAR